MKHYSFLLFACLFSILLFAAHCKKDRFELPPETTTGAMTFGCKVNGKVFVPRDGRGKLDLYCQYANLETRRKNKIEITGICAYA